MRKRMALLLTLSLLVFTSLPAQAAPQISLAAFGDHGMEDYREAATDDVPWSLMAAIDYVEWGRVDLGGRERLERMKAYLPGFTMSQKLYNYGASELFSSLVVDAMKRLENAEHMFLQKNCFPLPRGSGYAYQDTWGAERTYGGVRPHLGIDLIVDKGTPIQAIAAGTVTRKGWDEKGGWRIGITDSWGIYYYYAHMSAYANMEVGDWVEPGQIIGYVGSTGYGPEGTDNVMIPHLHIGLYEGDTAVNPYPYLIAWER